MNIRIWSILSLLLFFSPILSLSAEWKEYGLKEVLGRLKYYAFAKIAQSVRRGANFDQEIRLKESPCEDTFPELEGEFRCSWLRVSTVEAKDSGPEAELVGKWYEGHTLAGKGVLSVPGRNGSPDLRIFYHTDGRISHYSFGDRIVVFDWKGQEISTILSVKVDSQLRPLGGKEYFFP
ncbi:hypothetical protein [Leptospira wolffii]|uniref:hypothetical protein n=1 Tax=Leptospira wolffii TaxID=409998 RepID=UPI0003539BD3|nr:hypothetical protein [Leptospira wolffii]EPG67345.1 hypothetical protein LEP1GSC061_1791 [Leptospira wolffii serovar Khorat str. Khorat-H2]